MAPEICIPSPELSSLESDVWSFGCIILETTSGREPWIDQFSNDTILFQALQNKKNASVFAEICVNQSGPSDICNLLIRCCCWSKINRPRFIDILDQHEVACNRSTFIEETINQISIDEKMHCVLIKIAQKKSNVSNFNEVKYENMRSIQSIQVPKLDDNRQKVESKPNSVSQAKLILAEVAQVIDQLMKV